jgi:hypothetical protein
MIFGALCVGTPAMVWTIGHWGTPGAAALWVLHGVTDLTLGLWLMHRRLLTGDLVRWYLAVVMPPLFCGLPIVGASWWMMPMGLTRWWSLGWLFLTGLAILGCAQWLGRKGPFALPLPSSQTEPIHEA